MASGAGLRRLTDRTVSLEDVFLEVGHVTEPDRRRAPPASSTAATAPTTGPRTGVRGAMRSLVRHSVQRVLGLKRTAWTKVLPILTIFIAYVPAIVFVGVAVLIKDRFAPKA